MAPFVHEMKFETLILHLDLSVGVIGSFFEIGDVFHGEKRMEMQHIFESLQERKDQIRLGGNLVGKLEAIFAEDAQKRNKIKPRIENSLKDSKNFFLLFPKHDSMF